MTADPSTWERHVIVVGLDGVGLRAVELLRDAGVPVAVVDPRAADRLKQQVAQWEVPLLTGSPRLAATLQQAGIMTARAVLCVEGQDVKSLETALLARELRPDLRVVLRLANAAVGQAMTDLGITVLDTAGLAAPAVVDTCLRRREHAVDAGGVRFVTAGARVPRAGTLRELYGDLAPVAVVPHEGPPALCPGRDVAVAEGDEVILVGTSEELISAGLREEPAGPVKVWTGRRYVTVRAAPRVVDVRRAFRSVLSTLQSIFRRSVRITLGLLALLVAVSAVVLRLGYVADGGGHLAVQDAVYFTIETIATVGFGDFSFAHQPTWLEFYGIFLIVAGTGLVTTNFAMLTNALVSRGVEQSLGISQVDAMRGHIVVVGLGAIGVRVLDGLLDAGRQVVVVEADPANRHLGQARSRHVPVVFGDATLAATLSSVQVNHAAAVAILTSDDLVNVETGLAVRQQLGERWARVPVVLRVFDRQLASTVEKSFGFGNVRSTSSVTAPFFVGAALGLTLLGAFAVASEQLLVGQLTITTGGGLDGLAMAELSARSRVLALQRENGQLEHPPRRDTRFAGGDVAYVIGPYDDLLTMLRRDSGT